MLKLNNLHVAINGKEILKGIDLTVNPGEVHAIMGPNGSGKSTLASVLAGRDEYEITEGGIIYSGRDLPNSKPRSAPARACSSPSSTRSRSPAFRTPTFCARR